MFKFTDLVKDHLPKFESNKLKAELLDQELSYLLDQIKSDGRPSVRATNGKYMFSFEALFNYLNRKYTLTHRELLDLILEASKLGKVLYLKEKSIIGFD